MATLFEISADMQALEDLLTESEGTVTPEAEAILAKWAEESFGDFETKCDNYAALVRHFEARAAVRAEEADRLAKRAKIDQNNARNLKDRLKLVFGMRNVRKLDTRRFSIGIQKNGGLQALEVADEKAVPAEFTKTVVSPDNEKIRKALDAGEEVPGCRLLPRGESLRIR